MEHTITAPSILARSVHAAQNLGAGLLDAVELIFNAHTRVAALQRLLSVSDAQLQARGLTRSGEIDRILDTRR